PGSVKQYSWGPVRCSRPAGAALLRCPQTLSASVSALALGLPRLGARAPLAPCGRCAAPMPPDPVGQRERSRARPPTPLLLFCDRRENATERRPWGRLSGGCGGRR